MATPGANISYKRSPQLFQKIINLLQVRGGTGGSHHTGKLCMKDGAPVTHTAADAPAALYDLCYDYTNNELYLCTAYGSTTSFTWTHMTP